MSSNKGRMVSKRQNKKPTAVTMTEEAETGHSESATSSTEMIEQFEREVNWCIEQILIGLETQKPDSRQAREAEKVLRILTSPKAPVIKKRQVMRTTFGDYRKKMLDQDKKSATAAKKIKLTSVNPSTNQQSMFLRKSASKSSDQSASSTVVTDQSYNSISAENNQSEARLSADFKFNFSISETVVTDKAEPNTVNCDSASVQEDKLQNSKYEASVSTKGLFMKSDNSFKFNFTVPEESLN